MWQEGKPKSQSEKCEVSLCPQPVAVLPSPTIRPGGQIDTAIIAKLSPIKGERVSAQARMVVT
jgi:hypothetical protein